MAINGTDKGAAQRQEPVRSVEPLPEAHLDARLERLGAALDEVRPAPERDGGPEGRRGADYSRAVRMSSEFVAAILVGAALGWGLDRIAGTGPWGLIIVMMLGFAAGVLNVLRSSGTTAAPRSGRSEKDGGAS